MAALEMSKDAPVFTPGASWKPSPDGDFGGMLRGGYWNPGMGWWMPYYLGKLKSFNIRTGFGFLECEKTYSIYNNDVYIHKSQVVVPWQVGQPVEFAVTQNNRGQPQAADVMWLPMTASTSSKGPSDQLKRQEKKTSNTWYIGTLKSYSTSQGYGFISSEDTMDTHSCDVYLDRGQLPSSGEWRHGQVVEFEVFYNRRGQPQARSVNWEPAPLMQRDPAALTVPRPVDLAGTRQLNKILIHLRDEDRTAAIKVALEFQESSDSIDFLAFALQKLGVASRAAVEDFADGTPIQLLIALSRMLANNQIAAERVHQALSWCEAVLPELSPQVIGMSTDIRLENVISLVHRNLETAAGSAMRLVDRSAYDPVLAQVAELLKTA